MAKRLSVKNLKTWMGMDMPAYSVSLYFDNKRVGTYVEEGNGGPPRIDIDKNEKEVVAYAEAVCKEDTKYVSALEWLVPSLVDEFEANKKIKSWCRTKTVVTRKGFKEGEYSLFKVKYTPEVGKQLRARYPDIVEIVNERFI